MIEVIENTLVQKTPEARVLHVVIGDMAISRAKVESLIAELRGAALYVELYLYADRRAIAWSGWIAHAVSDYNNSLTIDQNNDPDLRRAIYEAFH